MVKVYLLKLLRLNWLLLALLLGLCTFSVYMVYSATYTADSSDFRNAWLSQRMFIPLGLVAFFGLALIDYHVLLRYSPYAFGVILFLLVAVLVIGSAVHDSKSWIRLGGFNFQPAELSKLVFILFLARVIQLRGAEAPNFLTFLLVIVVALVPMALILKQPDLGSASVFLPIAFVMMFVGGVRIRYLLTIALAGGLVIGYTYWGIHKQEVPIVPNNPITGKPLLKPYQVDRIRIFYNPALDPRGAGWQLNQSLAAIGSGGIEGAGYAKGPQNLGGYLPKDSAYNDFIFSVIGEELGFKGGLTVICLLGVVLLSCVWVAVTACDLAGALIASGVAALLFTHIYINIGMTIQVMPITGIPLPFVSYGGTFLVVCLACMGLVQSVWIHRQAIVSE